MQNEQSITPPLRRRSFWASLCAVLTLAACASLGSSSPEAQVRQRATERWQHMVARNIDQAYGYTTPAFRAVVTADAYRGRFGAAAIWVGAEVVQVNCPEATKCQAVVRLDFKPTLSRASGGNFSTHINEAWLLEDGQWWLFEDIKGE
ncbi:MAG: hypothetical protein ABI606_00245 [Rhodoferax sp.]